MKKRIAIDLGASKVVVGTPEEGLRATGESLSATCGGDGAFLEIGGDHELFAAGGNEEVVLRRVFRDSTVVPEYTRAIIEREISRRAAEAPCERVLFSIPCGFGEVEENALSEMAVSAGAHEVHLIYSPIAALVGNGLDLSIPAVVVDIGASRTDAIVICRGRIVYKKTYSVGGQAFDAAIAEYLLKKHKVIIDLDTAETVKIGVGTVWVGNERRTMEVRGRDATNGDYCSVRISSEEMLAALEEPMAAIIEGICQTITKIPPDSVQEVFGTGILLAGGGCLLEGIDKMISGVTGVNASRLKNPQEAVGEGLLAILDSDYDLRKAGTRNISRYMMKMSAKPKRGAME